MAQLVPPLSAYGLSKDCGFLSSLPVPALADPYYAEWENILARLQPLLQSGGLRAVIDDLPILSTSQLQTELQWRRAYLLLVSMLQGYVWSGAEPSERIPPPITIPLKQVSEHLELPPMATYAGFCLWNYVPHCQTESLSDLSNLGCAVTFTGTVDEHWFYKISMAIEAYGAPSLQSMLEAIEAAHVGDSQVVADHLNQLAGTIDGIIAILHRIYESCDPRVFYHQVRPYLAGSKGMENSGLPNGVWYDDGSSNRDYRQYAGISNAQSSLIQFFDIVLGIEHRPTGVSSTISIPEAKGPQPPRHNFIHEMRKYMPGPHRRFLEDVGKTTNIRSFVESRRSDHALCKAYDSCLEMLCKLRDKHLQVVSRYIIIESRKSITNENPVGNAALSPALIDPDTELSKDAIGTGGTSLMPFLKQARNETTEPVIHPGRRLLDKSQKHAEDSQIQYHFGVGSWNHHSITSGSKDSDGLITFTPRAAFLFAVGIFVAVSAAIFSS
ncbi:Indoleamine 2,3-dioxygenase family protein [Trichoderma simmonsii]|uniref:Indoleamine 2,3-dioxygenase family protein n=1 Tax=Trichoderma simmonsii TaxID=1491479 RepID=A0A8G0LHW0_9HYPO|nr:Indoleamine 2,3-dioxygenase family protein [Trichoderma simmonsii]